MMVEVVECGCGGHIMLDQKLDTQAIIHMKLCIESTNALLTLTLQISWPNMNDT